MTVGFEGFFRSSLERGIKQTKIPEVFCECLNFILLLAQDEIIQGQTYIYPVTRPGSRSCQSCLAIYTDRHLRHTEGNGRKYAQGTDFTVQSQYSLTTESFISSEILWYRMKYTQKSLSLLFCKFKSHYYHCDPLHPKRAVVFCFCNLKTFWKQELYVCIHIYKRDIKKCIVKENDDENIRVDAIVTK